MAETADDPRVSVIPLTREAIARVTTPYTAFEQPFPARPGRLSRQADALDSSSHSIAVCDTWPDALHNHGKNPNYDEPLQPLEEISSFWRRCWPETALYRTELVHLIPLDLRIQYRPLAAFFYGSLDQMAPDLRSWHVRELSGDGGLVMPDRAHYPMPEPAPVRLGEQRMRLSVIMLVDDNYAGSSADLTKAWFSPDAGDQVLLCSLAGRPSGQVFNEVLAQCVGEYIAVADPEQTYMPKRLERQLALGADVCAIGSEPMVSYTTWFKGPDDFESTLLFHRRVFERLGGCRPQLHVGHFYDLFLRAIGAGMDVAVITDELTGRVPTEVRYGRGYACRVLNDIAVVNRLGTGFHEFVLPYGNGPLQCASAGQTESSNVAPAGSLASPGVARAVGGRSGDHCDHPHRG